MGDPKELTNYEVWDVFSQLRFLWKAIHLLMDKHQITEEDVANYMWNGKYPKV